MIPFIVIDPPGFRWVVTSFTTNERNEICYFLRDPEGCVGIAPAHEVDQWKRG